MIDPSLLTADTRLYLRPIWFAESPVGLDGQTARMGGGLLWFQGYEISARLGSTIQRYRVSVPDFEDWCAHLIAPLAARAAELAANIGAIRPPLALKDRMIRFDVPQVMGIMNMTPDSFSDGGRFLDDPQAAADAGFAMMAAGAAMVDVGGESTRPRADKIWEGDEIARVVPVIERLAAAGVPVSIDTRKAGVMEAALSAGAALVNDVSALAHDPRSLEVVANAGCPVVLMHSPSSGDDPHEGGQYQDVVLDVYDTLEARIAAAQAAGIARERIVVDPGLGFGKTLADNLAILNRLALYQGLGVAVLLGASRKRMIGALSNEASADQRLGGSLALAMRGVEQGAQLLRVHDVPETIQAVHVWRGLRDAALMSG
ncbi:MAG: dihydropteroate synthase [Sphingobium sp.]|jgi:dihydropteroate synthase|nr:dihydropteroate synthase [Sphingobium sp.]MCI1755990.1 dihydropteroate synthase [Sphingobium sp.]MCI2053422.1 dihydropteroate synthase [Sphingobium sp.]